MSYFADTVDDCRNMCIVMRFHGQIFTKIEGNQVAHKNASFVL